jgi:Protein phosphatase 2A regulatory B subunit (B56 family)
MKNVDVLTCNTEIPADGRPELFIRKLHQCSVLFDFNDASAELKGKQIKAQALHEMLDYVTTQRGVITENVYPEVINMVGQLHLYLRRVFIFSRCSSPPICFALYHPK